MKRVLGAVLFVLGACSQPQSESTDRAATAQKEATDAAAAATAAAENAMKAADAAEAVATGRPTAKADEHGSKWEYSSETDKMTDKVEQQACIDSDDQLDLSPPYHPVYLRLCLRKSPRSGLNAFVRMLGDGQFLYRSYDTGRAKVRFGKGPVQSLSVIGPSDNSTETFFFRNAQSFESSLRKVDSLIIEPEVYQAGTQAISFTTKGLSWRH